MLSIGRLFRRRASRRRLSATEERLRLFLLIGRRWVDASQMGWRDLARWGSPNSHSLEPSPYVNWFYRVLLGFTGFYWVLLGFIGFYWVLMGFTGVNWVLLSFTRFHWVLLGFTRFYWVLLGFIGFHWILLGFNGFYWGKLGFTRFYWV